MKSPKLLAVLALALMVCASCGGGGGSNAPTISGGQYYAGDTIVPTTGENYGEFVEGRSVDVR